MHQLFIVLQQLIGCIHSLLARMDILIETHQIPIKIQRRRHSSDDLLLKLQIRHFQIIFLHADIAAVHGAAKSVQQILRQLQIERATGIRIEAEESAVN